MFNRDSTWDDTFAAVTTLKNLSDGLADPLFQLEGQIDLDDEEAVD